jgi:hypothetical protein
MKTESAGGTPIEEWYEIQPRGLEHGLILGEAPCRDGRVTVEIGLGELRAVARPDHRGVDLADADGTTRLHYTDLSAVDADGVSLAATMAVERGALQIDIDARAARFPIVVDPLVWSDAQDLGAADGVQGDKFGASVAVSGAIAVVGAPAASVGGQSGQGAAYVFASSSASWSVAQKLVAVDGAGNDAFGSAVAASSQAIFVGAPKSVTAGPGSVYVFAPAGGSWVEQQKLVPADSATWNGFGQAIAVSGTTAVVAAPFAGAAYVFEQSGTQWVEEQKLAVSAPPGDVGATIALSGDTILVGTPYTAPGAVYVFTRQGGAWAMTQVIVASDHAAGDLFGGSLAVFGDTAVIRAPNANNNVLQPSGAAYVFGRSGTTWGQQQKLFVNDATMSSPFGPRVAVSDTTILLTAAPPAGSPAADAFAESTAGWSQDQALSFSTYTVLSAVSISGNVALVGDPSGGPGVVGSAHVLTGVPGSGSACATAADCGSAFCVDGICCDAPCGPCGACATGTCVVQASGSAGVPACSPYACDGVSASCPASCDDDGGCAAGDYCLAAQCVPQHPDGSACTADDECTGGHCAAGGACALPEPAGSKCTVDAECAGHDCVDGFCCDMPCAGQCEACDVPGSEGTCMPVQGAPRGARPACAAASSVCGNQCDGTETATCVYPGIACGSSCADGVLTDSACNGQGACLPIASRSCGNFACADAAACKAACLSNQDCLAGFTCDPSGKCIAGAACRDDHTSVGANGTAQDCSPYECDEGTKATPGSGACKTRCASAEDCASPNVCSLDGLCLPQPSGSSAADGCSTGASPESAWWALGVCTAFGLMRGRRAKVARRAGRS